MILLILIQFALAAIAFLLFEAGNFREYAESFYIFATSSLKMCTFSVTMRKKARIFKLIDDYENIIENRELSWFNCEPFLYEISHEKFFWRFDAFKIGSAL